MRLGAAGSEGARHPEDHELAAGAERGQVHLLVGRALHQLHRGNLVSDLEVQPECRNILKQLK